MADGVPYISDAAVIVGTDYCGSAGHVAFAKLSVSADGDATPIPADPIYGLAVDVKRLTGSLSLSGSVNISGVSAVSLLGTGIVYTIPLSTATQLVSGNINAFQGTSPWVTSRTGTGASFVYPVGITTVSGNVNISTQKGADNFVPGQTTVTSGGVLIVGYRAARRGVSIVNHGNTDIFLGGAGVTVNTGLRLKGVDGNSVYLAVTGAITGIVSSTSQTISYIELYD